MATIVRYVNTASTAGGDGTTNLTSGATRAYATLSAAETALRQNLTGVVCDVNDQDGANTIALDIQCTGTSADTTAVTFTNASWVTDATHRIQVRLNTGDAPAGALWSTSKYRLTAAGGYGVGTLSVGKVLHIDLVNLQVENTSGIDNAPHALRIGNFASDVRVYGGFYRCTGTSGTYDDAGAISSRCTSSLKLRNVTMAAAEGYGIRTEDDHSVFWMYNCTLINRHATNSRYVAEMFALDTGSERVKNNILQGVTGANVNWRAAVTFAEQVTNLTQDTSSPNNTLDSKTVTFNDAANWDYHLGAGDTAALNAGTDLSADANWPFSVDADGATRTGTWDVGADEITGSIVTGAAAAKLFAGVGAQRNTLHRASRW